MKIQLILEVDEDRVEHVQDAINTTIDQLNDSSHRGFGWSKPIKETNWQEET